jgi:hypothetical protein
MMIARALLAVAALLAAVAPVMAQDVENGRVLYQSLCRGCHGFPPSGGPERAEGNPAVIQGAINGRVPAMGFLRQVVTALDVADIAAYLESIFEPQSPVPAFDYTDLWWNPVESGWGLNLIQHASDVIFGVMYTYEPPNRATWLVIPGGTWISPSVYSGPLFRVAGPHIAAPAFDPADVNVRQVGSATIAFADRDNATYTFSVDGVSVTKPITRQPF